MYSRGYQSPLLHVGKHSQGRGCCHQLSRIPNSLGGSRSGNVDDRGDFILLEDFSQLALILDWDKDLLDGEVGFRVDVLFDVRS